MEIIREVGATAFIIATYRSQESSQSSPLFEDPYAEFFLNEQLTNATHKLSEMIPEMGSMVRYRTKYFDDKVSESIKQGYTQVVLLGSGFDMRACRSKQQGVSFFDVDQSAVIKFKSKIIQDNLIDYPSKLITCNYLEDDLISKLIENGVDTSKPTLFVWEGNSLYIPEDKIYQLLKILESSFNKMSITFDFISDKVVKSDEGLESTREAKTYFDEMFSPWVTGFEDITIVEQNTSFKLSECFSMKSLEKKYTNKISTGDQEKLEAYSVCVFTS